MGGLVAELAVIPCAARCGFSPGCRKANQMPEDMNPDEGGWFVGKSGEKPSTLEGELNYCGAVERSAAGTS